MQCKFYKQHVTLLAITLSFFLSYLLNWVHQQPFNVDGILYLKIGTIYIQQGLQAAFVNFNWPFYAIFIAWIAKLTHLSLESAAFLLDAALISLLCGIFITLIQDLGGNLRTQYWALLIILIYPFLNHDRLNLLRDFGYYTFALLSFLFFLRYLRAGTWRYTLSWIIALLFALLFRIEGVFLLALVPFAVFMQTQLTMRTRFIRFFQLNCINIIILMGIIFYSLSHWNAIVSLFQTSYAQFFTPFAQKNLIFQTTILNPFSKNLSPLFLGTGLSAIFIATVISILGLLYALLSLYGFTQKLATPDTESKIAFITYIVINIIVTAGFLIKYFFLSGRYVGVLCLILLLAVPFSLNYIFSKSRWKKWSQVTLIIWLGIVAINGLGHFGTSKTYIIEAGKWIDQNTNITSRVYSNDAQLSYYSRRAGREYPQDFAKSIGVLDSLKQTNLQEFNYLALNISHKTAVTDQQISRLLKNMPIKIFRNSRGDRVLIYQVQ